MYSLITVMTSKMQIIGLQFLLYLIQFWMNFYDILESIEKNFLNDFVFCLKLIKTKLLKFFLKHR